MNGSQEEFHEGFVAGRRGGVQGAGAGAGLGGRVSALGDEEFHNVFMGALGGEEQGGEAILGLADSAKLHAEALARARAREAIGAPAQATRTNRRLGLA